MIIYLVVKTHNKTGLKYLCQTIRDPFKYKGSGTYWKRHLREHGNSHSTIVIKECLTKQELKEWGMYYSKLWNIVDDVDSYNKKTWANLKPEEGDGGASGKYSSCKKQEVKNKISKSLINLGNNHPSRNRTSEQTKNLRDRMSGNNNFAKRKEIRQKISENNPMKREDQKDRQRGSKNPAYNSTLFTFKHKITNEVVTYTCHDFCKIILSDNDRPNICKLIKNEAKSVKGWILI
jgi:hypothetical protein